MQALPCYVDHVPHSISFLPCRKHSEQADFDRLQVSFYLGALALETVAVPIHSRTLGEEAHRTISTCLSNHSGLRSTY